MMHKRVSVEVRPNAADKPNVFSSEVDASMANPVDQ
jgi:hypothetical protein